MLFNMTERKHWAGCETERPTCAHAVIMGQPEAARQDKQGNRPAISPLC